MALATFNRAEIVDALLDGIVIFDFIKANGDKRRMRATLKVKETHAGTGTVVPVIDARHRMLSVFDTEINEWRQVNWDTLQRVVIIG